LSRHDPDLIRNIHPRQNWIAGQQASESDPVLRTAMPGSDE